MEVPVPTVQDRHDLDSLTTIQLTGWLHSKGHTGAFIDRNSKKKSKSALVRKAKYIRDNPECKPGSLEAKFLVQDQNVKTGLEQMTLPELRAWVRSNAPVAENKGKRISQRDYLNRALELQAALEAGDTYLPQTREDLKHLTEDGLTAWLISVGDRMNHRASWVSKDTTQALLRQAEKSWDSLHKSGLDVSEATVSEHGRLKVDNHIKPNEDGEDPRPAKRQKITIFNGKEEVQFRAEPDPENPPDLEYKANQKPVPVKSRTLRSKRTITTPQTRKDILRTDAQNLRKWLTSQGQIMRGVRTRAEIVRRAEEFWDARENGTVDDLPVENLKRLKVLRTRKDIPRMSTKDLQKWVRS